jgi:hypothetical protein
MVNTFPGFSQNSFTKFRDDPKCGKVIEKESDRAKLLRNWTIYANGPTNRRCEL